MTDDIIISGEHYAEFLRIIEAGLKQYNERESAQLAAARPGKEMGTFNIRDTGKQLRYLNHLRERILDREAVTGSASLSLENLDTIISGHLRKIKDSEFEPSVNLPDALRTLHSLQHNRLDDWVCENVLGVDRNNYPDACANGTLNIDRAHHLSGLNINKHLDERAKEEPAPTAQAVLTDLCADKSRLYVRALKKYRDRPCPGGLLEKYYRAVLMANCCDFHAVIDRLHPRMTEHLLDLKAKDILREAARKEHMELDELLSGIRL